jgi:hypothetical protein
MQVKETNGIIKVTGTYTEMQDIYPKLKGWGFRYDGSDRSWGIEAVKLTGLKRKRFDDLLGDPLRPPQTFDPENNRKMFHDLPTFPEFGVIRRPDGSILISANVDRIKSEAKAAGGETFSAGIVFDLDKTNPDKFKDVVTKMTSESRQIQDEREARKEKQKAWVDDVIRILDGKKKKWPIADLTLYLSVEGNFIVAGNTYHYRDQIKSSFNRPTFASASASWVLGPTEPVSNFVAFIKAMDASEKEAEAAAEEKIRNPPVQPKRENRRPDVCRFCHGVVDPGEGWLIWTYDNEGGSGDFIWVVEHKDPKVCAQVIEEAKERERLRANKQRTRQELRDYSMKHGKYVKGDHTLQGDVIMVSGNNTRLYGGGEWIQIEPDGRSYWYVVNNGADGDDWSVNNVVTGGAGAIGRKVDMTDEARLLIEVVQAM